MRKKIILIANRASGAGRSAELIRQAKAALWGWDCEFRLPDSRADFQKVFDELDPEKYEAAIVLGGDGTMNQILPVLLDKKIPLLPFPAGTANDLAGELGLTGDWEQVQRLLDHRQVSHIDLLTVNGFAFSTIAGIGVGALVTQQFNDFRSKSPMFARTCAPFKEQIYSAFSLKNIFQKQGITHKIRVECESFNRVVETSSLMVCNQSSLGGSMKVAPGANNTDGKMNVLILTSEDHWGLIRSLLKLRKGEMPIDALSFSTQQLRIRDLDRNPIQVFGDGETITRSHDLDFQVLSRALPVYREVA